MSQKNVNTAILCWNLTDLIDLISGPGSFCCQKTAVFTVCSNLPHNQTLECTTAPVVVVESSPIRCFNTEQ